MRVLKILGGLIGVLALIVVVAAIGPGVMRSATHIIPIIIGGVLTLVLLAVVGFIFLMVGGSSGGGTRSSGHTTVARKKSQSVQTEAWRTRKNMGGEKIIERDTFAPWAHGGETYYKEVTDLDGTKRIVKKKW